MTSFRISTGVLADTSMKTRNIADRMQDISREVGLVNRNLHGCFPEESIAALRLSDFSASLDVLSGKMHGFHRAMDDCAASYVNAEEQASNDFAGLRAGSAKNAGKAAGAAGAVSGAEGIFGSAVASNSVSPAYVSAAVGSAGTVLTASSYTKAEIGSSVSKKGRNKEAYIEAGVRTVAMFAFSRGDVYKTVENMREAHYARNEKNTDLPKTAEEAEAFKAYVCESCGAQIVADGNTMATECCYCGHAVMLPHRFEGMLKPDYIIPFQKTKEDAKAALKAFCEDKWLLPSLFKSQNRIEAIQAVYVPFWLFDSDVDAYAHFRAEKVHIYETSDEEVTETSHYECLRSGSMAFERIPVDGSQKMDDTYMESIEPFDYSEMVPFSNAYMTGFLADKYDVDAEASVPRADKRVQQSAIDVLRDTVEGYDSVSCTESDVRKQDGAVAYCMAPVWIVTTRYQDKPYTFMMNGQSGKVVGSLPYDMKKAVAYGLAVFAVLLPLVYYLAKWLLAD